MKFKEQERVLCFHGPLLYECKVLSSEEVKSGEDKREAGINYFIHYKGWKRRWDEWVPEAKLLKYNAENIMLMRSVKANFFQKKAVEAGGSLSGGRRSAAAAANYDDDSGSVSSSVTSSVAVSGNAVRGAASSRSSTRHQGGSSNKANTSTTTTNNISDPMVVSCNFMLERRDST